MNEYQFKVGDTVTCPRVFGTRVMTLKEVKTTDSNGFPITIEGRHFTREGRRQHTDELPALKLLHSQDNPQSQSHNTIKDKNNV